MSSSEQNDSGPASANGQLALRFISGKYQGGEIPLHERTAILVGRSSELDMVLVEEMVSRRHARIELVAGKVLVKDLGSTNGTFVNGERVEQARLLEGDRLLVGTSILKLVSTDDPPPGSRGNLQQVALGRETIRSTVGAHSARMSGNLEEIPLPDLMQLFGTSKKNGTLVVLGEQDGRFHLREGLIVNAELEGLPAVAPEKAAYRMLGWNEGTFSLEPEEPDTPQCMKLSAQAFLMEGFRQQDEMQQLLATGPQRSDKLTLKNPLKTPVQDLAADKLESLQLLLNVANVGTALERSNKTDLEVLNDIKILMQLGYLEVTQ